MCSENGTSDRSSSEGTQSSLRPEALGSVSRWWAGSSGREQEVESAARRVLVMAWEVVVMEGKRDW